MAKERRKPGRPKTTGPGTQVVLRCHEDFLVAVDRWRERQNGDKLTRAQQLCSWHGWRCWTEERKVKSDDACPGDSFQLGQRLLGPQ